VSRKTCAMFRAGEVLRVAGRNSHVCSLTKAMSAPWISSGCFGKNTTGEGALDVPIVQILGGAGEDELSLELERLLAILAERDSEIITNLRGVIENWDRLPDADKRFMINTISYAISTVKERIER